MRLDRREAGAVSALNRKFVRKINMDQSVKHELTENARESINTYISDNLYQ